MDVPRNLSQRIRSALQSRPSTEMVVVGLIVLLALALIGPTLLFQREQARQRQKDARLRNIGQSLHSHHDTFQSFPADAQATAPDARQRRQPPAELISPL